MASTATIDEGGRQLTTVGAAVVKLTNARGLTPFVVGGAGMISNLGDSPSVTLTGNYSFQATGTISGTPVVYPFSETDSVRVVYSLSRRDFVGVAGAGATYAVTPRSGIRGEVRAYIGRNSARTTLDASPSTAVFTPPLATASFTNPSLQFVNNPPAMGHESTLSGSSVDDFVTFDADGTSTSFSFTAGW